MATITSPRSESPAVGLPRITSPSLPSASGTPTSSVRPSFDIPRTSTSSPAPQQNPGSATAHRRNRAALRDYYNLKGKAPSAAGDHNLSRTASIASNASDSTITSTVPTTEASSTSSPLTARLDDPSFDAETYVAELLKTAGLRDILKTESALVSEIRNLDGERKALVYDNYSKLIKAVGTIAEMQKGMHKREEQQHGRIGGVLGLQKAQDQAPGLDGVEKLAEKLDGLLQVVRGLAPDADAVRTKQLVEARKKTRQKEKVKWALDAPSRLQGLIDQGHEDEALKEYKAVVDLLDHWKGVAGVDELRAKCDKAVAAAQKGQEQTQRDGDADSG